MPLPAELLRERAYCVTMSAAMRLGDMTQSSPSLPLISTKPDWFTLAMTLGTFLPEA